MPISDAYVVQYLLQETCRHSGGLVWREKDAESYSAELHSIEVELSTVRWRSGPRVFLTLTSASEHIDMSQPVNRGLFHEKYDSSEDEHLAHLMKRLAGAVAQQCLARAQRTQASAASVRESIYRRLIGAELNGQ